VKIKVFGDSHSRFFEISEKFKYHYPEYKDVFASVEAISGASATGLLRKKSTLELRQRVLGKHCINPTGAA